MHSDGLDQLQPIKVRQFEDAAVINSEVLAGPFAVCSGADKSQISNENTEDASQQ